MPTVARRFAHTLKEIGVQYVFGVPSGNMIDYIEALRQEEGIEFILVGHESTAAFMAGIVGRLTGIPGVCFATFGPGATNLSTGIGGALLDRFPMLAFTDEMPENLRNRTVQMNIDHQALFQPITKWTTRIGVDNINEIILKSAGIAVSGYPGPVHIGVPAGMGLFMAEENDKKINYLRLEKELKKESDEDVESKIEKLFVNAEKPILVVGLSAVRANIKSYLIEFAERFNVPVVLTPMAKGIFPEDHRLYAGVFFHALSDLVAQTCKEADLVIGIGYDPVEFSYEEWIPYAPLIHIDEKPADINNEFIPEVVNFEGALTNILNLFMRLDVQKKKWNTIEIISRKNEIFSKLQPSPESFGPLAIVDGLRKKLPEEGILTVDVGAHLHLVGQQWITPSPEKLLMTNGWSSMGFAIPAALAAKLCHPELPVVCLTGDGGFLMMAGELAVAKRLNLKIVFVVICDESLSLIRIKQGKKGYDKNYGTPLVALSNQATNHYFGVPVIRVFENQSYLNAIDRAFTSEGPVVIEAVAEGTEYDELLLKRNR